MKQFVMPLRNLCSFLSDVGTLTLLNRILTCALDFIHPLPQAVQNAADGRYYRVDFDKPNPQANRVAVRPYLVLVSLWN